MKKEFLFGIIGLIVGIVVSGAVATYAVNGNHTNMMKMYGMNMDMSNDASMSMDEMTSSLQGKTGDDFDKTFLAEMISHHQGAIDMANLAKQNAKHQEVKNLATDIVTAQTKEIAEMQQWQQQWGYATTSTSHDMNMMH